MLYTIFSFALMPNYAGGVTKYQGGKRCFIIPAGYLGCAFWGSVFVVLSGDRTAALISACVFLLALVVSLFFAPNKVMVMLSIGFIVLTGGFILLDRFVFNPLLQYLTLYYGVFIGSFSVYVSIVLARKKNCTTSRN